MNIETHNNNENQNCSKTHSFMNYGYSQNIIDAICAIKSNKMILVFDSDSREGETDMIIPANAVTKEIVFNMRRDGGGLICVALDPIASKQLGLPFISDIINECSEKSNLVKAVVEKKGDVPYDGRSSFSIWVNHRSTRTGIIDIDRAKTINKVGEIVEKTLSGEKIKFSDEFRTPGHVALLRAADGLLNERAGHTELSLALAKMANTNPAMVVCEMLDNNGSGKALSKQDAKEYGKNKNIVCLEGKEVIEAFKIWCKDH